MDTNAEMHPKMPAATQEMVNTISRELTMAVMLRGQGAVKEVVAAAMNCAFAAGLEVAISDLNEALKQAGRGLVRGDSIRA